jgi:hypothetical protein
MQAAPSGLFKNNIACIYNKKYHRVILKIIFLLPVESFASKGFW